MMGNTMPTQSSLSDLRVLLQLMQAAADPKKSQELVDYISGERQKYDDAIAESMAKAREAAEASNKAQEAIKAAEEAKTVIAAERQLLESHQQFIAAAGEAIEIDRAKLNDDKQLFSQEVSDHKAEVLNKERSIAGREANLAAARLDLDSKTDALNVQLEEAAALKAEYEAKLAKFKELTA